ncbi:MerR family transcriptional regulator [Streptomyces sp. NPDC055078]
MFTIGDFARHGRVSARMLRHYDAIGLLRPDRIDPFTGYRYYSAAQLARLNRVIALKDLGFTLEQVRRILDDRVSTEELRGMLVLRRAELAETVTRAAATLGQVEARLRSIESEGRMPADDVIVKSVPAARVAELTAVAPGYGPEHIGPVIGPLFDELSRRVAAAGVVPSGPGVAHYEDAPEGDGAILVHASLPVPVTSPVTSSVTSSVASLVTSPVTPRPDPGFGIVELPAIERAATIVHRGSMNAVVSTAQVLARWIEAGGHRGVGYAREVSLETPDDPEQWVTELQEPLA